MKILAQWLLCCRVLPEFNPWFKLIKLGSRLKGTFTFCNVGHVGLYHRLLSDYESTITYKYKQFCTVSIIVDSLSTMCTCNH